MKGLVHTYREKLKNSPHLQQSFKLMMWNYLSMPIALVTNIIITRYMGSVDYGNYHYVQRVFEFVFILVNFGLFRSVGRGILLTKDKAKIRSYYGFSVILWVVICLIAIIILYSATFIAPNFKEKGIQTLMWVVIPFCTVYYLNHLYDQILPSSNEINLLIIERYLPQFFFLIFAAIIYFFFRDINISPIIIVWTAFLGLRFLMGGYVFGRLKPTFSNLREDFNEVRTINKDYGIKVYTGDLFSNAFYALTPILISWFSDTNADVGFYSLAVTFTAPLTVIPSVISTSHYREFATYKKLPSKIVKLTLLLSVSALVLLLIVVPFFVRFFYTEEFTPVIAINFIVSFSALLRGFSDFISRYLAARGDGKALRNSSFIVGFTTLALNVAMIPLWGAMGAAYSSVISGTIYLLVMIMYYRKNIKIKQYE